MIRDYLSPPQPRRGNRRHTRPEQLRILALAWAAMFVLAGVGLASCRPGG